MPQARQREQIGLALEHLTLARKHPSHDALSRGCRGFDELDILLMGSGGVEECKGAEGDYATERKQ